MASSKCFFMCRERQCCLACCSSRYYELLIIGCWFLNLYDCNLHCQISTGWYA